MEGEGTAIDLIIIIAVIAPIITATRVIIVITAPTSTNGGPRWVHRDRCSRSVACLPSCAS